MSFSFTSLLPRSDRSNLRRRMCTCPHQQKQLSYALLSPAEPLHEVVEAELAVELVAVKVRLEDVLGQVHETSV